MGNENLEILLDLIADALIQSEYVDSSTVNVNQKTIRNGIIQTGRDNDGRLVLYQKDVEANKADLQQTTIINEGTEDEKIISELQNIANQLEGDFGNLNIEIKPYEDEANQETTSTFSILLHSTNLSPNPTNITDYIVNDGEFSNVSQFIPIVQESSNIDVETANEYLDTNIFELLPSADTRQARVIRFFQELNALLPPNSPQFDLDADGRVDRNDFGDWINGEQYSLDNSISSTQNYPDQSTIEEEQAFLHRLKADSINANESIAKPNDTNSTRTIDDIYNRIKPYLTDILEEPITLADERETYQNISNGYLQFRHLNQGIIIRNTNKDFIQGLNPNTQDYLTDGFTITMWVRFLDKTSSGTLFNFGNPTRSENPFGFKLETYIVNRDDPTRVGTDYTNFGEFVDGSGHLSNTLGLFQNTNSERFVRLQVREFGDTTSTNTDNGLRDSHVGNVSMRKFSWNPPELNSPNPDYDDLRLLSTTHIPQDFNEWYFICATYNPNIIEPNQTEQYYESFKSNSDFWMNHINPITTEPVANSGYGNKAKVEIISRTDLLRARGFKV